MKRIIIDPVTRIEGHAKITIQLDDAGEVMSTQFHVTQVRGFEKFVEGRPFYEMPGITARICGICPVSHLLAAAKACDAIMAVRIPPAGALLRELIHCAQFVQSHALSFFHLSAPDLLLGMDSDPAARNVLGLAAQQPELARAGIVLRQFGQRIIEAVAGERVHPSGIVPGGVSHKLEPAVRDEILRGLPAATSVSLSTLDLYKKALRDFEDEIANFGSAPTMYAGLTGPDGGFRIYDGAIRFRNADGTIAANGVPAERYADYISERSSTDSYLKSPYYKPLGSKEGVYRVGPLARLNVAEFFGTPRADAELEEYRTRFGPIVSGAFHYHYARLLELLYALERIGELLAMPEILDARTRARAEVNALEGVGIAEAPRGLLIHHYKVNEQGGMVWANLIVATGHNNLAIGRAVEQTAKRYIHGNEIQEGMLNRVSAVVRAYDPCLSCSTHAGGLLPLRIQLTGARGEVLDEVATQ